MNEDSSVGLTSTTLMAVAALLAVGLPAAALLLWNRLRGPRTLRVLERLALVGLAQGFAVLLALVAVNDQYLFFTSWQDLLGSPPPPGIITSQGSVELTGPSGSVAVSRDVSRTQTNGDQLLTETVQGGASHLTGRVLIRLPAGYATSGRSYPVVELLQGWHAPPESWITNLGLLAAMGAAERDHAIGPVILVMPDINLGNPRDVECTNVPRGPQAETWLTTDVRDLVLSQFRALPTARSWGLMGFSTGGYCAAKFALHRPGWYATAVVMSGYFEALKDSTTGDLWGGSRRLRNENAPAWLVTQRTPPPIDLLVFTSRQDSDSYPSSEHFLKLVRAPMRAFSLVAPRGGHNFKALRAALPEMLGWLGAHLTDAGASGSRHTAT